MRGCRGGPPAAATPPFPGPCCLHPRLGRVTAGSIGRSRQNTQSRSSEASMRAAGANRRGQAALGKGPTGFATNGRMSGARHLAKTGSGSRSWKNVVDRMYEDGFAHSVPVGVDLRGTREAEAQRTRRFLQVPASRKQIARRRKRLELPGPWVAGNSKVPERFRFTRWRILATYLLGLRSRTIPAQLEKSRFG